MKTRHFHFVCFLLLLATLGAGEAVPSAASLLARAGQISGTLATKAASETETRESARLREPAVRASLEAKPLAALRTVWSMRPPAAQASALQAVTAQPAPSRRRA